MENARYQPPTTAAYFDPSRYPKRYTYNTLFQVLMGGFGIFLLLATVAGVLWLPQPPLKAFVAVVCLPLSIYWLTNLAKSCIILGPQSIELRRVFSSRTLQRADILGRRRLRREDKSMQRRVILVPRHPGGKTVRG